AQTSNAGGYDAFVAEALLAPAPPAVTGVDSGTGAYAPPWITSSQTLKFSGTAVAGATVTLYRSGGGGLGSVLANATSGTWVYDYTGTTLPEGTYALSATQTVSGKVSPRSVPEFLVAVDRTGPSVQASVPSSTPSRGPQVRVSAQDLNGLP